MDYDGTITIGTDLDTKEFDKQIDYIESQLEEIEYKLKQADLGFEVGDTQKLEAEYERLSNRLVDLRKKKEQVNDSKLNSEDIASASATLESGIGRITKKLTRMGLAMIGIRSLYGMISSSISRITETQPELKAQIDAIKNAIDNIVFRMVQVLLPVIESIVGLVATLMQELFGVDIYANNFSKGMSSGAKSAAKLRKQLMGFDEVNVLNKDGTTGAAGGLTGGSTSGTIAPKLDTTAIKNQITNKAFEWGQIIIDSVMGGGGFAGGIAEILFGKDSVITKGIKIFNASSFGMGFTIWNLIFGKSKEMTYKDLKEIFTSTNNMTKKTAKAIKKDFETASVTINNGMASIVTQSGHAFSMTEAEYKDLMNTMGLEAKATYGEIKLSANLTDEQMRKYINNTKSNWISAGTDILKKYSIKDKTNGVFGAMVSGYEALGVSSNQNSNETKSNWISAGLDIIKKFNGNDPSSVVGAITGAFATIDTSSQDSVNTVEKNFGLLPNKLSSIFDTIKKGLSTGAAGVGGAVGGAMAGAINSALGTTENTINNALKVFRNLLNKMAAGVGGAMGAAMVAGVSIANIKLPRVQLAKGGIIYNQPGRGINYGNANIGERGREGVVPLDNDNAMNTLANEIAKRITINLTSVTELDGRQIARGVSQVMNNNYFASNGGVI